MANIQEQALWESFLLGDERSFEQLFSLYHKNLYEFGMRKTNDEEQVKDAIQDLFVRLWANRKNIGHTANVRYYLLAALKNQLINAGINKAKMQIVSIEDEGVFRLDFTVTPATAFASQPSEKMHELQKALNALTSRQKEILYLRYFEELSYEEIATMMNVNVKAVYKLHYRALDALKEILQMPKLDIILLLGILRLTIFR